jgi:hypothetical protein
LENTVWWGDFGGEWVLKQFHLIKWVKIQLGVLLFPARRGRSDQIVEVRDYYTTHWWPDYIKKYNGDIAKATYHYCKDTGLLLPNWINEDGSRNENFSFPSREEFDKQRRESDPGNNLDNRN